MFESKDIREISTVEDDSDFRDFIASNPAGIRFIPKAYGDRIPTTINAEGGDFAKWIQLHNPSINVDLDNGVPRLVLCSGDIYLPLAFLASDVAFPIYLNLVSSYLWEKTRGALKSDKPRIHFSAEYEDKVNGVTKRFKFEGDADALQNAIKPFDLNRFLDE